MERIDEYIDSIFNNADMRDKMTSELKNEMKKHLIDSAEELKANGISEDESINISIERFGEINEIRESFFQVIGINRKLLRRILLGAIAFLIVGLLVFAPSKIYQANINNRYDSMINNVYALIIKDPSLSETTKANITAIVKKDFKTLGLHYIAVFPKEKQYFVHGNTLLKDAYYIYPDYNVTIKNAPQNSHSLAGIFSESDTGTNLALEWQFNGYDFPGNRLPYIIYYIFITCLAVYWSLFAVWAMLKANYDKRSTITWIAVFWLFNIIGYLIFIALKKRENIRT
ncbi:MAG: permease prefix domain 1-containing protein [Bacillota bacterium]|nr:permease prefix domain 1-containing protein [Bacillota bacterium]